MGKYEEVLEEGRGPRVPRSRGPKEQDISNSHLNTSLSLKKVHLVQIRNATLVLLLNINFVGNAKDNIYKT